MEVFFFISNFDPTLLTPFLNNLVSNSKKSLESLRCHRIAERRLREGEKEREREKGGGGT